MIRRILPLLVATLLVGTFSKSNKAQAWWGYGYGWDYYGGYWGGWGGAGSTVEGSILAGMGLYLQGAGQYNYYTAQADQIELANYIQWNEYLAGVSAESARRYKAHNEDRAKRRKEARMQHYLQLRDRPTPYDIRSANAINLKMRTLSNPKIADKVFNTLKVPLDLKIIDALNFQLPSAGLNLTVEDVTKLQFPADLRKEAFESRRVALQKTFNNALEAALKENLTTEDLAAVDGATADLKSEIGRVYPNATKSTYAAFFKRLEGYKKAIASDPFMTGLGEIRNPPKPTLGGMMRVLSDNRMQIGGASTKEQIALYERMYNIVGAAPTSFDRELNDALMQVSWEEEKSY